MKADGRADQSPPVVRLNRGRTAGNRPIIERLVDLILPVVVLVLGLLLWHWLVDSGRVSRLVLPRPWDMLSRFWDNVLSIVRGEYMWRHFKATMSEVIFGFCIAVAIGITIGTIVSEFRYARAAIRPYILAFNSTPRIVFAPLVLVWFGFGMSSKVVLAASIAVFPIIFNTVAGLQATEAEMLRLMRSYRSTRWEIFRKVRFWVALPYLFAGLEMAVGLAFLGAVAGEFVGGSEGLGYIVLVTLETLDLASAFATIFLLSAMGFILHRLVLLARHQLLYWLREEDRRL